MTASRLRVVTEATGNGVTAAASPGPAPAAALGPEEAGAGDERAGSQPSAAPLMSAAPVLGGRGAALHPCTRGAKAAEAVPALGMLAAFPFGCAAAGTGVDPATDEADHGVCCINATSPP